MERIFIILAAFCFTGALLISGRQILSGRALRSSSNFRPLLAGFLFLTSALYLRGRAEGSCPLNSLYDLLIFQSWSLVLIYLLVGSAYRLSLLGVFTAPLALLLLVVGIFAPISRAPITREGVNPWIETHAALSMIAYGAFGLACVAGTMYLVQERQLKTHRFSSLLYNLPPITDLAVANRRLLVLGFLLLTAGFASGFASQLPVNTIKFIVTAAIWFIYGAMLAWNRFRPWPVGRMALCSVLIFVGVLATLPGVQYLSAHP